MMQLQKRFPIPKILQEMTPIGIHGLACLVLTLAFFSHTGADDLAPLRLAETRLNFLVHLFCNGTLLAALYINARERQFFFRLGILPPLAWLVYLGIIAASSPIPAAAFEQWMFWLDAVLLFYIGQSVIARRPDIFFLMFAVLGILLGVLAIRTVFADPHQVATEHILAVCASLMLAATLVVTGRHAAQRQRSFFRFLVLLAIFGVMTFLLRQFSPGPAGAPESVAMEQILKLRPLMGSGIGSLPDILPSFAPQDYAALPLPPNSWQVFRAESGWFGIALLLFVILLPVLRLLDVFHENNGNGISFLAFGLAGVIIVIALSASWHSFLSVPFGRLFLFLLLGIASSYGSDSWEEAKSHAATRWDPGLAVPALGFVLLIYLSYQELRPYRAASLAVKSIQASKKEDLLAEATRIYPLEASLWDARAAAARATFKPTPWRETAFQDIVRHYNQSLRLNPFRFKTYASLANLYDLADRPYSAESVLKKGLAYLPRNETLRRLLIAALNEKGNFQAALREMEQLAQDLPSANVSMDKDAGLGRAEMQLRVARVYEEQGDWRRASTHYSSVILENPTGPFASKAAAALMRLRAKETARPVEQ